MKTMIKNIIKQINCSERRSITIFNRQQQQRNYSDSSQIENNSHSRNYVTNSKTNTANIVNGPVHPLTPPTPPIPQPTSNSFHQSPQSNEDDVEIIQDLNEKTITIKSELLKINNLTLPYILLRDFCQSSESIDPATQQKLFKTTDIPLDIHPIRSIILRDANQLPIALSITWSHHLNPSHPSNNPNEYQTSTFNFDFLKKLSNPDVFEIHRHKSFSLKPTLWISDLSKSIANLNLNHTTEINKNNDNNQINWIQRLSEKNELIYNYKDLLNKNNKNLKKNILEKLNEFGLIIFDGLKSNNNFHEEEDELKLKDLINNLGLDIRRTFYGDLWDVISAGNEAKNIANTNLPLDFHMDLVHFENPPRFQFLHCIKNDVEGGISGFVDSYSVAFTLLKKDPEAFKILTQELIGFEYINDNHHTEFKHPTIQLKNNFHNNHSLLLGELIKNPNSFLDFIHAINYSPPFQSPFLNFSNNNNYNQIKFKKFLISFKKFQNLFNFNSNLNNFFKFEILLKPGQVIAFDNRRILHSRTAFKNHKNHSNINLVSNKKFDQVDRWLKGAYVDGDSVWDRIRVLNS